MVLGTFGDLVFEDSRAGVDLSACAMVLWLGVIGPPLQWHISEFKVTPGAIVE